MSAGQPARRVRDVTPERIALLNGGTAEAATLTECLVVDFAALMRTSLPGIGQDAIIGMEQMAGEGISRRMVRASQLIHDHMGATVIEELSRHASDTVRGWACFIVGTTEGRTLCQRLSLIRPLADDHHFGVREWAWMAVRPHIANELDDAIEQLAGWTGQGSERLRRFASEATRPRGVWCTHISALRQKPELALPILEPLRADPSAYVQDSVGNWLNDAGKDRKDWVRDLTSRWLEESGGPATSRICKRGLRSIDGRA